MSKTTKTTKSTIPTNMHYNVNINVDETGDNYIVDGVCSNVKNGVTARNLSEVEVAALNDWLYGIKNLSLFNRTAKDIEYRATHDVKPDGHHIELGSQLAKDGTSVKNIEQYKVFTHIPTPSKDGYLLKASYKTGLRVAELYVESANAFDTRNAKRQSAKQNVQADNVAPSNSLL